MASKKTIKKVEAPIDQHETFVSLQKSFADSDLSVEEKLRTLYELQKADSEIDNILQLRGELPREVEALVNSERCAQRQLEAITNSREYDSLNKEIENQDLLRQIEEKKITDTKAAILEHRGRLEEIKDKLSILSEDLKAKKAELDVIVESTAKEEEVLRGRRDECAAKIDARTMSAYERIRSSVRNHLAVVSVYNGDSCGGCFNTITPQRLVEIASNRKLIICEHCGRIIINADVNQ